MNAPARPGNALGTLPVARPRTKRRGWDLNPRRACALTSLAGRPVQPDSGTSPGTDDAYTPAEGGGFEPPEGCPSTVFKTVAIVRSAIPPAKRRYCRTWPRRSEIQSSARRQATSASRTHRRAVGAGRRVGAEELHVVLGLEVAQAVGHQLVVEVALEVDDEAVVTEAPASWAATPSFTRLMARAANSWRMAEQRPGRVGPLEHDDGRLVVPRGRRDVVTGRHHRRSGSRCSGWSSMSSASTSRP